MNTQERSELLIHPTLDVWDFATDTKASDGGIEFQFSPGLGATGWIAPENGPPLEPQEGRGAWDMGGGGLIIIPLPPGTAKACLKVQQFNDGGIFKEAVAVMSPNSFCAGFHDAEVTRSPKIGFWMQRIKVFKRDEFNEGDWNSIQLTAPKNGAILTRLELRLFPAPQPATEPPQAIA